MRPPLGEFDLIRRFFSRPVAHTVLPGGDDAALLQLSPGMQLAVSTDMLVSGRHFFANTDPFRLGWKSLAVNLSDLAAMAATPRWATLSLALPGVDEAWLEAYAAGFYALAAEAGVDLVGGDTTRGPLTLCVQIMGEVPPGKALQRNQAQAGDDVWVSGTLGLAALGLQHLLGHIALPEAAARQCIDRLEQPLPRVSLGLALSRLGVRCAMDISDGLLGDLGHILSASAVGAQVELAALPLADFCRPHLQDALWRECILSGGDDYELLFTAPVSLQPALQALSQQLELPLTRIGRITAERDLGVWHEGQRLAVHARGYDHFGGANE